MVVGDLGSVVERIEVSPGAPVVVVGEAGVDAAAAVPAAEAFDFRGGMVVV